MYPRAHPSGSFYAGGDVAVARLWALGGVTVALTGDVAETGETPAITKAGDFGRNRTMISCLELPVTNDE